MESRAPTAILSKDQPLSQDNVARDDEDQRTIQDHEVGIANTEAILPDTLANTKGVNDGSLPASPVLGSIKTHTLPSSPASHCESKAKPRASRKSTASPRQTSWTRQRATGSGSRITTSRNPQGTHGAPKQAAGSGGPSDDPEIQQPGPAQEKPPAPLDHLTEFWEKYNKAGDGEDKEFVKSSGGDLDVVLIFAGLFSAIDTAFIIESYKGLKPDHADEATKLLRSVILLLHNSTYSDAIINPPSFVPTSRDVRVNCFFFVSLCCSLCAAFGAVLAKQWLTQYDQEGEGSLKSPADRGRERQKKYEGRGVWRLEDVIFTLPTLLQFSLFFFLVGLADFSWPLNTSVTSIIMVFSAATFLFYATTISISVIDRSSPFQTRMSALLTQINPFPIPIWSYIAATSTYPVKMWVYITTSVRGLWRPLARLNLPRGITLLLTMLLLPIYFVVPEPLRLYRNVRAFLNRNPNFLSWQWVNNKKSVALARSLESRCVVYLLKRMTLTKDLETLMEAVELVPDDLGMVAVANTFITRHLKPAEMVSERCSRGLHSQEQHTLKKMLRIVLKKVAHFLTRTASLPKSRHLPQSLTLAFWDAFLAYPGDQEVYDSVYKIFLTLSSGDKNPTSSITHNVFLSRDAVKANLNDDGNPVIQERTFHMVGLLATMGAFLDDAISLMRAAADESPQIVDMLQSTMWEVPGYKPVLDVFWLSTLRVEILSSHHVDDLGDSQFSKYLGSWFEHFSSADLDAELYHLSEFRLGMSANQQMFLYWTYLFSVHRLLSHSGGATWSRELTETGHLSCLRSIVQEHQEPPWCIGEPLALWALLCLWKEEEARGGTRTNLFLTRDCIQLVGDCVLRYSSFIGWRSLLAMINDFADFMPTIWTSHVQTAGDMAQMLGWLFSYLEAAKTSGLLDETSDEKLVEIVGVYSEWCTGVNSVLPEDRQHTNRYEELRARLLGNRLPSVGNNN